MSRRALSEIIGNDAHKYLTKSLKDFVPEQISLCRQRGHQEEYAKRTVTHNVFYLIEKLESQHLVQTDKRGKNEIISNFKDLKEYIPSMFEEFWVWETRVMTPGVEDVPQTLTSWS